MDLRLFSIEQMPSTVPIWDSILEDLGHPPAERIARVLGVSRATVYRWNAAGRGPRVAALALFWLTRWGRSAVHTQATNDALLAVALARSQGEERQQLRGQVEDLERSLRQIRHQLGRGSAAIEAGCHTDTAHEDRGPAGGTSALAWPVLALPQPVQPAQAWPELPPLHVAQPMPQPGQDAPDADRPGSRAAPPPTERSATDRARRRSGQPRPSGRPAVGESSP